MTEWGVVGVLAALIALVVSIITPIIKLNTSIVKLTTVVDGLETKLSTMEANNANSHDRIWNKLDEHTGELQAQDRRIIQLEGNQRTTESR